MPNAGDTLQYCTGTGKESDPYKFQDWDGFIESIQVDNSYVEASKSNLIFDANEIQGSLPKITAASVDGKGLTIRNLFSDSLQPEYIIRLGRPNLLLQTFKNVNLYNYVITSSASGLISIERGGSTVSTTNKIENCNFAGVTTESALLFYTRNCSTTFSYCTFNIHMNVPSQQVTIVDTKYLGFYYCTIGLFGRVRNFIFYPESVYNTKLIGTIMATNNSTLAVQHVNYLPAGWGYCDLEYICPSNTGIIGVNYQIIINRSNIKPESGEPPKPTMSQLFLQTTDPSADDYLYSEDHLNDLGFPIGTVIP